MASFLTPKRNTKKIKAGNNGYILLILNHKASKQGNWSSLSYQKKRRKLEKLHVNETQVLMNFATE